MSLILGAVQFGMEYGITNRAGQPSAATAFQALDAAWAAGVRVLDSAQGYGIANNVIAAYHERHEQRFSVINKIMRHPENPEAVKEKLLYERDQMGIAQFDCIMFHYAASVPSGLPRGWLDGLKDSGLTARVGLSIETPDDYQGLKDRFSFDVIQLPLNPLSQAFMPGAFLAALKGQGIEIHARSAFLQGLLLGAPATVPFHLAPLVGLIEKFQNDCADSGLAPATACLLYLLQNSAIDHIVVGAQDAPQLTATLQSFDAAQTALKQGQDLNWKAYGCNNFDLVHPSRWPELQKNDHG